MIIIVGRLSMVYCRDLLPVRSSQLSMAGLLSSATRPTRLTVKQPGATGDRLPGREFDLVAEHPADFIAQAARKLAQV